MQLSLSTQGNYRTSASMKLRSSSIVIGEGFTPFCMSILSRVGALKVGGGGTEDIVIRLTF